MHTSRGDVAIENIHEGDSVISRNAQTGKLEPEPVTALTPLHPSSLLEVRLEGQQTPLRPSINHPFWVKRGNAQDGSWLRADKMQVGDFVQSVQGAWRRVVAITPLPGQETVYNFTVAKDHDYFVGETGFLVHNAPPCNCRSGNFQHEFKHAPRFGVPGNWNNQNAALFQQALEGIVNGPNTVQYPVNFRGQFNGTAFLDQPSGLCVVFNGSGELGAAWDLGANQVEDLVVNGVLH